MRVCSISVSEVPTSHSSLDLSCSDIEAIDLQLESDMMDLSPSPDSVKRYQLADPSGSMGSGSLLTVVNDSKGGIRRDCLFYYKPVVIKAEDTLFCVPKNGLMATGNYFLKLFLKLEAEARSHPDINVAGTSDDNPIILEGVSKDHFRDFLRLIYPFGICAPRKDDQWLGILHLATEWNCTGIRDTALTHLEHLFRSCDPTTSGTPHDSMRALSLCMKYKIGRYIILQLEAIVTSIRPLNRSAMTASGIDEATILSIMEMREQWHCGIIWGEWGIKEDGRLFPERLSARIIIERYLSADSRFAGWIALTHLTWFPWGEEADRKREGEQVEAAAKELEAEELRVVPTSKVDCTQEVHEVVAPQDVEGEEPKNRVPEMEEKEAKRLECEKEAEAEARRLAKEARKEEREIVKREKARARAEKKQKEKLEKEEIEKRLRELEQERELQRKLEEDRVVEERRLVVEAEQQDTTAECSQAAEIHRAAVSPAVSSQPFVSGKRSSCEECEGKRLCKWCRRADKQNKQQKRWALKEQLRREQDEEEAERQRNKEKEQRRRERKELRQKKEEESRLLEQKRRDQEVWLQKQQTPISSWTWVLRSRPHAPGVGRKSL